LESIEEWIEKVQGGDTEAYQPIVEAFQSPIYAYCYRLLGNRQEAEDAAQDILFKSYKQINNFKPTVSFNAWVYKIAYRHCLNMLRKRRLHRSLLHLFLPDVSYSAQQLLEDRMFEEPLSGVIARLTLEERNLLVLRVLEDKSFADIAVILGKSHEAVKRKFSRLRSKIRNQMKESEVSALCLPIQNQIKTIMKN
jgi:RNA polymerase sigma factor (sigma-70 family)